jgi:hypothetical protein
MTTLDPLHDASCVGCGYSLRGLGERRCPECGRAFDPQVVRTMNVGRPLGRIARRLLAPVGRPTWRLHAIAVAAFFWGWGWLPGALAVSAYALLLLLALYAYRFSRLLLREIIIWRYRQPRGQLPALSGARYAPALSLLILFTCVAFNLPLRATLRVSTWIASDELWRMYAIDPMPSETIGPRFVGLMYAEAVRVTPGGVSVHVANGGVVAYGADGAASLTTPSGSGLWYGSGIAELPPPVWQFAIFFIAVTLGWIIIGQATLRAQRTPITLDS